MVMIIKAFGDKSPDAFMESDAKEFGRAAREHWKVENNLHRQMDFIFRDDKNSSMAKTGAK